MDERMYRAQILLDPRQRRQLEEMARRGRRSISSVTRQVIDAGLERLANEADIWDRRAGILAGLKARRVTQLRTYAGDLVGEARQEREQEMEQVWRRDT
jgi:hypothetical protein